MKDKISIIIPVYNEEKTLLESFKRVKKINFPIDIEIIIIDDCSIDKSYKIIKSIKKNDKNVIIYKNSFNKGKGACIVKGLSLATGTIIGIHDADLEYNPEDLKKMLDTMLKHHYDVVYGFRFYNFRSTLQVTLKLKKMYIANFIGNLFLNFIASLIYMKPILDIETGYKLFRYETVKDIYLESNRFDFEVELTAKLIRSGYHIHYIDISHNPRSYYEGKKIRWKDGIIALIKLIKYRISD